MNNRHRFAISLILTVLVGVMLFQVAPTVSAEDSSEKEERARLQVLIKDLQNRLVGLRETWQKASKDTRKDIKEEAREVRDEIKDARKEAKKVNDDDDEDDDSSTPSSKTVSLQGTILLDELPNNVRVSCSLPELKYISRNNAVYLLQIVLSKLGYYPQGLITGYYGRFTEEAVSRFENAKGLSQTRVVSGNTRVELNRAIGTLYPECINIPDGQVSEWDGVLSSLSGVGSTQMWGSYILKLDNGTTYAVKPVTDNGETDARKFSGNRVRVYGKLVFNNFEGGFWGIEATDVDLLQSSSITVTRPNSGDVWQVGKTYEIKWKAPEYKSGESVTITINPPIPACVNSNPACMIAIPAPFTIATQAANSGSFMWAIPSDLSSVYRGKQEIRVTINGTGVSDASEVFTIGIADSTKVISISNPKSGDVWKTGSTQTIRYSAPASVSRVNISLDTSIRCVTTPCFSGVSIANNVPNSGSYSWQVPSTLPVSNNYRIMISESVAGERTAYGVSDYFGISGSTSSNSSPIITGVTGPQQLKVNETGTWVVNAYDSENDQLTYSVSWGDEPVLALSDDVSNMPVMYRTQKATFTHNYSSAGNYIVVFTVTDAQGFSVRESRKVSVSDSQVNSAPRIVGIPAIPSVIRVGESTSFSWTAEDTDSLSWEVAWDDISLGQSDSSSCSVPDCLSFSASHVWARAGIHTVKAVVRDGRGGSDEHVFQVSVLPLVNNRAPVVTAVSGPSRLLPNQTGSWSIAAYDPEGGYLSYSVSWGDEVQAVGVGSALTDRPSSQLTTFSHVYNRSGSYTVNFTVTDASGNTANSSLTVDVQN